MYRAVIFDLDGTLLDSVDDILFYLNRTLEEHKVTPISRAQAVEYIGNGARELVKRAIGVNNFHKLDAVLADYKNAYAVSDNSLSRIYDGEMEGLSALKSAGLKLAILTNKPHSSAKRVEDIFFKQFDFDIVQGQVDGTPLKPAPDAVFDIMDRLKVEKSECLFVGDGETDVMTAANAGMDCVSVLWGYREKEQLAEVGGTHFVNNFQELTNFILNK